MVDTQALLDYAYNRLPDVYRDEDYKLGKPLYRYLQVMFFGGFSGNIEDINNILNLVDPMNCPAEFFPALYESFGLIYYEDIPLVYHRKFLANFGELRKRRGTYSCINFLCRSITGMQSDLTYLRGEYVGMVGRHLIINLHVRSIMDIINLDTSTDVIKKFVGMFVPYYITVWINAEVEPQDIKYDYYRTEIIHYDREYNIRPIATRQPVNHRYIEKYGLVTANSYVIRPLANVSVVATPKRTDAFSIVSANKYVVKGSE